MGDHHPTKQARRTGATEWPTMLVALVIHLGWVAATAWHALIPAPLLAAIGGWLIAWHGSLQHETIHGHPTRSATLNAAIGAVPLSLWLPYALYRRSHIAHHDSPAITDPLLDPESRYVRHPRGVAWLAARVQSTLIGRLLAGPPIAVATLWLAEARRLGEEPLATLRDWVPHLAGVALLLVWLQHVGLGIGAYLLLFVYPGMALTALRSFAEHRADPGRNGRAATVERGGALALLFLNNNLHAAHHERPGLPWYALPAYHRAQRHRLVVEGALIYGGYGMIVRRFAFRAHDVLVHPDHRHPAA
jgi:fatty acid desaturase